MTTAPFARGRLARCYSALGSDPVTAVDAVDMEVFGGDLAVVWGPSASGKTTLLGLLAGLDRPNSGRVELFGFALAEMSDAALALLRRTRVGLLFQDFKLLPGLPAWENVALPLVPMGVPARQRRRRAAEWLNRLGVSGIAERPPERLSGGQQQRVALARALVNGPDLLLADEPTSQVNVESAEVIFATFGEMAAQGKTVIITTHDPTLVLRGPKRFRMIAGRLEQHI